MTEKLINEKRYEFKFIKGIVLSKDRISTTEVYGSGGGGYSHQGTGHTQSVTISSTTTHKDNLFIKLDDGKEKEINLINWEISCRDGHELIFVWAKSDEKSTDYLVIENLSTDRRYTNDKAIKRISKYSLLRTIIITVLPVFLLALLYSIISYKDEYRPFINANILTLSLGIILPLMVAIKIDMDYTFYYKKEYQKVKEVINSIINQFK